MPCKGEDLTRALAGRRSDARSVNLPPEPVVPRESPWETGTQGARTKTTGRPEDALHAVGHRRAAAGIPLFAFMQDMRSLAGRSSFPSSWAAYLVAGMGVDLLDLCGLVALLGVGCWLVVSPGWVIMRPVCALVMWVVDGVLWVAAAGG